MTDWISDAEKAHFLFHRKQAPTPTEIREWRRTIYAALPRALKALRAADELAQIIDQRGLGSVHPSDPLRKARAAYRKARS